MGNPVTPVRATVLGCPSVWVETTLIRDVGKIRGPLEEMQKDLMHNLRAPWANEAIRGKCLVSCFYGHLAMQRFDTAMCCAEEAFVVVEKRWGGARDVEEENGKWVRTKDEVGREKWRGGGATKCNVDLVLGPLVGEESSTPPGRRELGFFFSPSLFARKIAAGPCCLGANNKQCTDLPRWDIKCAPAANPIRPSMASFDWPVVIRYRSRMISHAI